ncbi:MAG TPA: hypothetical protein VES67_26610 [Vicinamibacterales bacterium]|nr:hypothetical protein [Vicinamibacterales bacterium]
MSTAVLSTPLTDLIRRHAKEDDEKGVVKKLEAAEREAAALILTDGALCGFGCFSDRFHTAVGAVDIENPGERQMTELLAGAASNGLLSQVDSIHNDAMLERTESAYLLGLAVGARIGKGGA